MSTSLLRQRGWIVGVLALALGVIGVLAAVTTSRSTPVTATLPAGTRLRATLDHTVSTESARVGDEVTLTTRGPLAVGAGDTLPGGVTLRGEVTHARGGGRIAGAPELTVRMTTLSVDGRDTPIATIPFRFKGKNDATESALEIAGGTVAGAVLGQVAGKAPVEGAVIGAAAGTGIAVATKGDQVVLPAGVTLRVELTQPVKLTFRPAGDHGRSDGDQKGP